MWNLTRNELLTPLTPKQHPEFFRLLLPGEEMGAMAKMLPEQIMLRWANHHIRQYLNDNPDQKGVPKDFKISTSTPTSPTAKRTRSSCTRSRRSTRRATSRRSRWNPERAAQKVIDDAKRIGVDKFEVQPSDITEGRPRMNLAFLAAIINSHPALEPVQGFDLSDIMAGEAGDGREERAFRMWLQSLGLNFTINNLYDDCRSGLVILRTEDHLEPGCVDWSKVNMNPKSIYERVENCNYACDVAKKLKMKVVGIGGKDIAEGSIKLTLAVVWQLMRADVMKFLAELDMDEKDIRRWANKKVAEGGFPHLQIGSFRDPQLRNGVFILQLLRAVAPECVQADEILPGKNASECKLNAKYAISCAHKMGCRVFCTWEDIVEARPKMIICLFAAAMAEDMRRQGLKKEELLEQVELMEELEELKMEVAPTACRSPSTTTHHPPLHSPPPTAPITPQVAPVVKETKRRSSVQMVLKKSVSTLHKLESTIEIVEDVVEEVVEGQGFRALDIVLLRRRLIAFVAIALPLGLGASAWLGVVLAGALDAAPDLAAARRHLQDDEEELQTADPATDDVGTAEEEAGSGGGAAPLSLASLSSLLDTLFDTDAGGLVASVTLLCLTPALAAIVARLISREGLPWFPSSCGDCFRGRYAQSTPTAARVRWPFVVALWSASLLLPTLLTAAGAATYFGALPDHFSTDQLATLPKEIRELSPGGVAVSMLLLLGVLMPLPFLPLFLLIESGLRGYFVTRLRLALPPRASVCIGALFPAVVALPIFGMGHLYGTTHPGAPAPAIFVALWYMMAVGIVSGALALCQGSAVPSSFLVGSATCLTLVPVLFAGGDALMIVGPTPAGALGSLYWALTAAIVLWRLPAWERKWHPLRAPNMVMGAARDASQADDETKAADDRAARKAAKEPKKDAKKAKKDGKKGKPERTTDDHVHIDIGKVGGQVQPPPIPQDMLGGGTRTSIDPSGRRMSAQPPPPPMDAIMGMSSTALRKCSSVAVAAAATEAAAAVKVASYRKASLAASHSLTEKLTSQASALGAAAPAPPMVPMPSSQHLTRMMSKSRTSSLAASNISRAPSSKLPSIEQGSEAAAAAEAVAAEAAAAEAAEAAAAEAEARAEAEAAARIAALEAALAAESTRRSSEQLAPPPPPLPAQDSQAERIAALEAALAADGGDDDDAAPPPAPPPPAQDSLDPEAAARIAALEAMLAAGGSSVGDDDAAGPEETEEERRIRELEEMLAAGD